MTAADITRVMHTRALLVAVSVVTVLCGLLGYLYTDIEVPFATQGLVSQWSGTWIVPRLSGFVAECSLNLAIVCILMHFNQQYNLLRSFTYLQGTFFLLIQLVSPSLVLCMSPGTVMCVVVLVCMMLMLQLYGNEFCDTRKVFLVFVLLSGCSSFDIYYLLFIPVMLGACMQMRVFGLRTLVASLLGILTPWIIFLGFGIVTPDRIQWPPIEWMIDDIYQPSVTLMVATALYTCFVTFGALLQNMIKILTYNAQSRAFLGMFTTLTLVVLVLTIVNSANIYFYLPLLNSCCALQLAHLFGAIHTFNKSYIAIVAIAVIYMVILVWKLIVTLM